MLFPANPITNRVNAHGDFFKSKNATKKGFKRSQKVLDPTFDTTFDPHKKAGALNPCILDFRHRIGFLLVGDIIITRKRLTAFFVPAHPLNYFGGHPCLNQPPNKSTARHMR